MHNKALHFTSLDAPKVKADVVPIEKMKTFLILLVMFCTSCAHHASNTGEEPLLREIRRQMTARVTGIHRSTPDVVERFRRADDLIEQGSWTEAREAYVFIMRRYPTGHATYCAYFLTGVCADHLGEDDRAIWAYGRYTNDMNTLEGRYAAQRIGDIKAQQSPAGDSQERAPEE